MRAHCQANRPLPFRSLRCPRANTQAGQCAELEKSMASKKGFCSLRCWPKEDVSFHILPKDEQTKQEWLKFIYGKVPQRYGPTLRLSSAHFTENCFINRMEYQTGFCNKLIIEQTAIPTIRETASTPTLKQKIADMMRIKKVAASSQTTDLGTRTVDMQLSASRLKSHVRSKATQMDPSELLASDNVNKAFQLVYMPVGGSASSEDTRPAAPTDRKEAGSGVELRDEDSDDSSMETETMRMECNNGGLNLATLETNMQDLFKTCPACRCDCKVHQEASGTSLSFIQFCRNCHYSRTWHCQRPAGSVDVEILLRCAEGVSSFKLVEETQDNKAETDRLPGLYRHSDLKAVGSETSRSEKPTPQHIVNEDAILQLTKNCPVCRKCCRSTKRTRGPYLLIYQNCYFCNYQRKWANQPEAQMLSATKMISKKKRHLKVIEATKH